MTLQSPISQRLVHLAARLEAAPNDLARLQTLVATLRLVRTLPFGIDLCQVQNVFYRLCHTVYPTGRHSADQEDAQARLWVHHCRALGELLSVRVVSV